MKKKRTFDVIRLALSVLVSLIIIAEVAAGVSPRATRVRRGQKSCSDSANDCKWPVKYLGEKGGCVCFACESGKKTQRTVCTTNKQDRAKLMTRVRDSIPKKSSSNKNVR